MTTDPQKRRRWFQFRLRTLFIAILVLSLPLSWFAWRMERARRQKEAVEVISRVGGRVMYDRLDPRYPTRVPSRIPSFLLTLLGDDFFRKVVHVCCDDRVTDPDLKYIGWLHDLEGLTLMSPQVTDFGLEHLKELTDLETLDLCGTEITDTGLEHLQGLTRLEELWLNNTQVTSEGIKKLQESLPNCKIE